MNQDTLKQLTIALDATITRVLQDRLNNLSSDMQPREIGRRLIKSQLAVRVSNSGPPPDYSDEWLAPLYMAWYGPSHINMAYTLFSQVMPLHDDTLINGSSGVHLEDFACGPFIGQFGFVLAAAEAVKPLGVNRRLSLFSDDKSSPMLALGRDIWKEFREEIGVPSTESESYPSLGSVRVPAHSLLIGQKNNPAASVWLTLIHAAYPGETGEGIQNDVDKLVHDRRPRLILLTAHPDRKDQMYCPPENEYFPVAEKITGPRMAMQGQFGQITAWRRKLVDQFLAPVQGKSEGIRDYGKVKGHLTNDPTAWRPSYFEYVYSLYVRKDA